MEHGLVHLGSWWIRFFQEVAKHDAGPENIKGHISRLSASKESHGLMNFVRNSKYQANQAGYDRNFLHTPWDFLRPSCQAKKPQPSQDGVFH